jgi:hypothetical protein
MRISLSALLIAATVTLGALYAMPRVACAWGYCPSYRCAGQGACGSGCVCMIPGGELWGQCVSLD